MSLGMFTYTFYTTGLLKCCQPVNIEKFLFLDVTGNSAQVNNKILFTPKKLLDFIPVKNNLKEGQEYVRIFLTVSGEIVKET